jgi:hypothetical protein
MRDHAFCDIEFPVTVRHGPPVAARWRRAGLFRLHSLILSIMVLTPGEAA